ncbi:NfeD family protein, partial [Salmonella enterica]|uniref:NfeD family protein n=1 Tax=Salmonella enterica TaxID=28901 RepID=UPI00329A5A8B
PLPEAVADEDDLLIGATGRVVSPLNPVGTVQAAGDLWTARSDRPLESGDEVIVLRRDGLMLIVEGIKHKRE